MRSRRKPLSVPASLVLLSFAGAVPLLAVACKQPPAAVVDAGPPPPAPTDAAPAQLAPLDEDAGALVPDAAPAHHAGGSSLSVNQTRAKQCCNALKTQAGTDPLLSGLVAQCNTIAMQMGPSTGGQAPEFAPLRQFLKGKNMPAICQGL